MGWSHTSQDNVLCSYEYGEYSPGYDWKHWLGFENLQADRVMLNRPLGHSVDLGTSTFYGYTAKAIEDTPSVKHSHEEYVRKHHEMHVRDSDISSALGAVAGLIYALTLSCVHCRDPEHMKTINVSCDIQTDLKCAYWSLATTTLRQEN